MPQIEKQIERVVPIYIQSVFGVAYLLLIVLDIFRDSWTFDWKIQVIIIFMATGANIEVLKILLPWNWGKGQGSNDKKTP